MNDKKMQLIGELGGLMEKIASGSATSKQIQRAFKLEAEIPMPNVNVAAVVRQSEVLSVLEHSVKKLKTLRLKAFPRQKTT